jgi:hypothetical protein
MQQMAPPAEIYDRPANRFVATFGGNPPMYVLHAAVYPAGLHVGGVTIPLEPSRRDACIAAEVAEIGTRPEDLGVVEAGAPGALPGEVYVVEPMGPETFVNLRIGDEHLSLRTGRGFSAPIGTVVGVRFQPSNACFFNRTETTVAPAVKHGGNDEQSERQRPKRRRRTVLKGGAGITRVVTSTLTAGVGRPGPTARKSSSAPSDGGLTPFGEDHPARHGGGLRRYLEDEYSVTLEKWFADAQSGAGQYDSYLLDDPWCRVLGAPITGAARDGKTRTGSS